MLVLILSFLAGLVIGSFLNVCIYRLPRDLSVVRPRSYCPFCEHPIAATDNVPLLSWALLGGRCRHCRVWIPLRYPAVELLTGLGFLWATHAHGPTLLAAKYCLFIALLIGLIFADLESRILPDEFTLGGAVAGVVLAAVVPPPEGLAHFLLPPSLPQWQLNVAEALLGAVVLSGTLWLVGFLYFRIRRKEGLGLGDVKMVAMIGAFLGLQHGLLTVILGSVLGSLLGLVFIWAARKDAGSYELPYGTFLGSAALLVLARL